MHSPQAESWFAFHTAKGQELEDALKKGKRIPQEFTEGRFSNPEECAYCSKEILPPAKVFKCSGCKAVIYCSSACSKAHWKKGVMGAHKTMCADFKRHMQRLPETQALILSFPWGRLEQDGHFNYDLARGRFRVLGGAGFGFWSHRGGPVPHANNGGDADPSDPTTSMAWDMASPHLRELAGHFHFLDGYDLLHHKGHLSDEEGWKLKPEYIPYRDLEKIPKERWPCLVTEFEGGVRDWDSWYRWRKIPKESPAALLMTYPLSVYQLLVHSLKFTGPKVSDGKDKHLIRITLLGAEVELNLLPLFSELALLLPHHIIVITVWGPSVHKLCKEMHKQGVPGSPLRDADKNASVVFRYTAPEELGGGSVVIMLHGEDPFWTTDWYVEQGNNPRAKLNLPDVMIALNAGIGSYASWGDVIEPAHVGGIPFAVTDYLEITVDTCVRDLFPQVMKAPPTRTHDTGLNPFHRPGQRIYGSYKMPNLVNGFTMVVVDRKHFLPRAPVIT